MPIYRALANLVPVTAVAVLLTYSSASAQLAMPNGGVTSLNPAMPSVTMPVPGTGVPMGATGLGTGGLGPSPLFTMPGSSPMISNMPPNSAVGIGTGNGMYTGSSPFGASIGTGLSPALPSPSPVLPSLAPGFPVPSPYMPGYPSPSVSMQAGTGFPSGTPFTGQAPGAQTGIP